MGSTASGEEIQYWTSN